MYEQRSAASQHAVVLQLPIHLFSAILVLVQTRWRAEVGKPLTVLRFIFKIILLAENSLD